VRPAPTLIRDHDAEAYWDARQRERELIEAKRRANENRALSTFCYSKICPTRLTDTSLRGTSLNSEAFLRATWLGFVFVPPARTQKQF
jgi:hypothetical protein